MRLFVEFGVRVHVGNSLQIHFTYYSKRISYMSYICTLFIIIWALKDNKTIWNVRKGYILYSEKNCLPMNSLYVRNISKTYKCLDWFPSLMSKGNDVSFDVNCMFSSALFQKVIKGNKCSCSSYSGTVSTKEKKLIHRYNIFYFFPASQFYDTSR